MADPSSISSLQRSLSYGCAGDGMSRRRSGRTSLSAANILSSVGGSVLNLFAVKRSTPEAVEKEEREAEQEELDLQKKQGDMWTQACYNSAVLIFVFITGGILLAVYYILEPFLQPLVWALLIGVCLHPFKLSSTKRIEEWLGSLDAHNVPLSLGVVLLPAFVFNWLAEMFEFFILSHWKSLTLSLLGVVCLWLAYAISLPLYVYWGVSQMLAVCEQVDFHSTSPLQVLATMSIGFLVLLLLSKWPQYSSPLKILSTCLWFLAFVQVSAYLFGSASLPLTVFLFFSAAILSVFWPASKSSAKITITSAKELSSDDLRRGNEVSGDHKSEPSRDELESDLGTSVSVSDSISSSDNQSLDDLVNKPITASRVSFALDSAAERKEEKKPAAVGRDETDGRTRPHYHRENKPHYSTNSSHVFIVITAACFFTFLWKYPLFLLLLAPIALWTILKYAFSLSLVQNSSTLCRIPVIFSQGKQWVASQHSVFFPTPLPTLLDVFFLLDKKVLNSVKHSIGSLVSACIIFGLLLSLCAVFVVMVLELQSELAHYIEVFKSVLGSILANHPHWFEGDSGFQETLETFTSQGYTYGREWLAAQVHYLAGESSVNASVVETRVLGLFDQLYRSYVLKNSSSLEFLSHLPYTSLSVESSDMEILNVINVETIISVLTSVWSILSDNLSMALSFVYAMLELMFSGGTALINVIIFITALFYLLCYSEDEYLPVQWVVDLLPQLLHTATPDDIHYGHAFSVAIRSVFHATLRKALFYGLYMWLIHNVFGLPVSILPSVLGAVVGAIPFVGLYWVVVPAALEQWLMEGNVMIAIALVVLSFLPAFFIDTIFYREIEGGHPYLTALAIAGGIYFAGLQGALLGPILLCCLLFVVNCYGDMNHITAH